MNGPCVTLNGRPQTRDDTNLEWPPTRDDPYQGMTLNNGRSQIRDDHKQGTTADKGWPSTLDVPQHWTTPNKGLPIKKDDLPIRDKTQQGTTPNKGWPTTREIKVGTNKIKATGHGLVCRKKPHTGRKWKFTPPPSPPLVENLSVQRCHWVYALITSPCTRIRQIGGKSQ